MRRPLFATVIGLVLVAGGVGQDAKQKAKDEERILGAWIIASQEKGGEKVPADRFKDIKVVFHADGKLTVEEMGKELTLTFKLTPGKKPKEIDVTHIKDGRKEVSKGIYALDKNTLKVCVADSAENRPSEFNTQAGTKTQLFFLKRESKE